MATSVQGTRLLVNAVATSVQGTRLLVNAVATPVQGTRLLVATVSGRIFRAADVETDRPGL